MSFWAIKVPLRLIYKMILFCSLLLCTSIFSLFFIEWSLSPVGIHQATGTAQADLNRESEGESAPSWQTEAAEIRGGRLWLCRRVGISWRWAFPGAGQLGSSQVFLLHLVSVNV